MLAAGFRSIQHAVQSYIRLIFAHPAFLGFGFLITFSSNFGQTFFISLYNEHFENAFGLEKAEYGAIYSGATFLSGLTILYVGHLIDHIDLRKFSIGVALIAVTASALLSVASAVWMLFIAIMLMRFSCQGLMGHIAATTMSRYFDKNRGKALSVSGLGYPAGEAVFPIIGVGIIAVVGWRMSWMVHSIGLAIMIIPLTLWLLRDHGDRHEQFLAEDAERRKAHEDKSRNSERSQRDQRRQSGYQWTRREVLRDPRFYLIIPTVLAPPFVGTGFFFIQTHIIATKGWSTEVWASMFVAFAATQVVMSIIAGPLIDRFGAVRLLPGVLIPECLAVLCIGWGNSELTILGFMIFLGMTSGIVSNVIGAMWAEVYGVMHLGSIRAMASSLMVFSTSASPVLMGWAVDRGWTIMDIAIGSCAYMGVATVLSFVGTHLHSRHGLAGE